MRSRAPARMKNGDTHLKLIAHAAKLACLCSTLALLPATSNAQTYPVAGHTIQFLVPYTPGTTADVLARLIGSKLAQRWSVPVVVENKAGASGIIGTAAAANAAPDGYTFLFAATSYSTIAAVKPKLPYDPVNGLAPVALLGTSAMTLAVNNDFPARTVREFVDQVKKQAQPVTYASPGAGSSQHLAMELFSQEAGIHLLHVPYKGTAGALTDMIGGHVQASVVSLQSVSAMARNDKLRLLGIMSRERSPTFPKVPTIAESGYPNFLVETWYGVMAPAGTPAAVIAKMNGEINSIMALPDVRDALAKQGIVATGGGPEKLGALVRSELTLWKKVAAKSKIAID